MSIIANYLAGYAGNTAKAYRRDLADFQAFFTGDVLTAKRSDVDLYTRSMETRELAPATIARRLSALSGLFDYAVSEELLARNPVEHVRRPKVSTDSQTVGLDQAEAQALLLAAKADGARSYALVSLLLHTAARIGEALALTPADITTDGGYRVARFVGGKGGKTKVSVLSGAAPAIDALLAGRTDGFVFASRTGNAMAQSEAFRTVQRLAAEAGIANPERVTPHSLRHTSITAALDADAPLHEVQDFAGHADPRMTQRYNRARLNLTNSPAHRLGSYFAA